MKPNRETWAEALKLLEAAMALPATQHDDWLAAVPVRSPHVKVLLTQLLADRKSVETANFLEASAALPDIPPEEFEAGQLVGPYRLVRPLGRGGMAVVWLSERADAAHRRPVALKLPQLDRGRARVIAERFLRERSILSNLAHPNITSVLDAGSDGSQPWLAMEFVDGQSLTQFCHAQALDLPERLRLFAQVLRAVQHAHAQGVIHRDLKPGNVLVDAQGQVKLLDFGVAKLLEVDGDEAESTLTQFGGRPMTPNYASPEQLMGAAVGTASDIYALGIMLFQLVLGLRPNQLATSAGQAAGAGSPSSMGLPRPSKLARSDPQAGLPGIATDRLSRLLAGDIDTIVLKALQERPDQRYATVDAFAEDIERHLSQRPILARPDSFWYRAAKFTARHKVGVASSALIVVALGAALSATLWQAGVARAEAKRAEATKRFLVGLFDNSALQGSGDTPAHAVTGQQLLTVGAKRLLTEYREPTELRLELLNLLGTLSEQLDLLDQSRALVDEALALTRQLHGDDDLRCARALLVAAEVKTRASDFEAALAQGAQALHHFGLVRRAPAEELVKTHILLGNVLDQLQRYDESQAHLESAVALSRAANSRTEQRSRANFYLARAFESKRDLKQAEAQYLDGITQAEKNFGPRSYIAAFGYENYGDLLRQMARFDEAQRYLRRSLDVYAVVLGPRHMTLGGAQFELGQVLAASGQRAEANTTYQQAIATMDEVAGAGKPNFLAYQTGVRIKLLVDMGRFKAAHELAADFLKRWPPGNPYRTQRIFAMGLTFSRVLITEGDFGAAKALLDEMEAYLTSRPPNDRYVGLERLQFSARRAEWALATGDTSTAAPLIAGALRQMPSGSGSLLAGLDLLTALSRTAPDAAAARAALDAFAKLGDTASFAGRDVENQARLDQTLGRLLMRAGDAAAAKPRLSRAVQLRAKIDDADSPWLVETRLDLAECLIALGQAQPARNLLDLAGKGLVAHPQAQALAARFRSLHARSQS